ncbi:Plasmid stabilization system [Candidatus Magnetobacterium bavaricum]|uniref:Plasmid stabilization system n=1 Tax=Candidatus Magnetobacterium bavaricum TaxID=29290 RepID=A0A0F3GSF9_9BACT|nr:Plasmid stabilization system [Candidatus Magnetobacterium bavaricum]
MRILKRPEAENDLEEIWLYMAKDNPDKADKFLDEIEETSRKIARFTSMGRNRDEIYPGLRSFPVGKYIIFYVPISDGLDIVRVQGYRYIFLVVARSYRNDRQNDSRAVSPFFTIALTSSTTRLPNGHETCYCKGRMVSSKKNMVKLRYTVRIKPALYGVKGAGPFYASAARTLQGRSEEGAIALLLSCLKV